jgi:hypothetical protein
VVRATGRACSAGRTIDDPRGLPGIDFSALIVVGTLGRCHFARSLRTADHRLSPS